MADRPAASGLRYSYEPQPFHEPDGRKTWAVKETVVGEREYFRRQLVSFHPTFKDAMTACDVAYRKVGIDRG